jgi:hypothetical protein
MLKELVLLTLEAMGVMIVAGCVLGGLYFYCTFDAGEF